MQSWGLKPPTLLDHLTLRANVHDLRARPMIAKAKSPGPQLKSLTTKMACQGSSPGAQSSRTQS